MNKRIISIIVVVIVVIAAGFLYITRPVAKPAQDISAASVGNQIAASETASQKLYRISSADSSATFKINEVLRGKPFTPVGTTNQIAGDIVVSTDAAKPLSLGTITIDAQTFKTDSSMRDGAITRLILHATDPSNEYISFKTTALSGVPGAIVSGTAFDFSTTGDLTISGVTKPVTLAVHATVTDDAITATATGELKRGDFNLVIPNIPFVASVDDAFPISVSIVAKHVTE